MKEEGETQVIFDNRVTQMDIGNGRDRGMKLYSNNDSSNNEKRIKKDIATTRAT